MLKDQEYFGLRYLIVGHRPLSICCDFSIVHPYILKSDHVRLIQSGNIRWQLLLSKERFIDIAEIESHFHF